MSKVGVNIDKSVAKPVKDNSSLDDNRQDVIHVKKREIKVKEPDTFDSIHRKLKQFIVQLNIYLLFNSKKFQSN